MALYAPIDFLGPAMSQWSWEAGVKSHLAALGERRGRRAALNSPARRASSARATATATAVVGGLATVGRVPSWSQGGRAGADGLDFGIVYLKLS
jgi:hypothetical protein